MMATRKTRTMHKVAEAAPPASYSAFFPGTTTITATTSEIPKDTVFYAIFPDEILPPNPEFMAKAEHQQLSHSLHPIHLRILDIVSPYTADYVWQHEPFSLSLSSNPSPNCPCSPEGRPHFHGKTRYGDNFEDEWFIVFLLFEISRKIPDLTIRVWDSDGEFLLFEAAEHLFTQNSANTKNRVFIRSGELNIVHDETLPSNSTLLEFLGFLACFDGQIGAPYSAQSALRERISGYPERARSNMHQVRVRVPISVAKVLKHEPCLISLAVEAFCNLDIDKMKNMEKFLSGCGTGKEELVRVSVRMSRAMYTKLAQQTLKAPECYPMPPRTDSSIYVETVLGMKIACGFEMMYQQRRHEGTEVKGSTLEDFKESIKSSGYFKDLVPRSNKYRRLMKKAQEYYIKSSLFSRASEMLNAPVRRIDEILALPHTAEEFDGLDLPPSLDDAWLYNGRDELKLALLKRQKQMKHFEPKGKKSKKGKEKKGAGLSADTVLNKVWSNKGAHFPVYRDSNAMDLNIERCIKCMGSVRLGCEGPASDADTEEESSSDIDLDYLALGLGGYYYGSDFSYDDFTKSDAFMDEDDTDSDELNEELMFATMMNSFMCANEQSSDNKGPSNVKEESENDLTPAEFQARVMDCLHRNLPYLQDIPGPPSTFLWHNGQQLPKDARKG